MIELKIIADPETKRLSENTTGEIGGT